MSIAVSLANVGIILITLSIIIVIIIAGRAINWLWLRPKRQERCLREHGLKGNSYKLLFGDLKVFSKMMQDAKSKPISIADDIVPHVLPFHHQIIKNYGKDSFIWSGPTPVVITMNPGEIKVVLNKIYDFRKNPIHRLARFLLSGLLEYDDEKWAKHRKIINPAFHQEKLKLMLPAFYQCCNEMINKWKTLVSEKGSCELDVWPFFHSLTGDVISRSAFGSSYEEGKRIFELQVELAELTTKVLRSIDIPGWRFLPTKINKRMKNIEHEIRDLLRGIILIREEATTSGKSPNEDLLGLLLESNYREIQEHGNNKNVGMSIEDVIDECKVFYFAGHETTSVLLNWTIVLLSKFPNWQEQARAEVMQIFGTKKPDYDGLSHLKVVTMVLYEVLRLYPPVPLIGRAVKEEIKLGNLTLPAGARISIPTILVHHDGELWGGDAKEFKPERFAEGVSKATKGQVSFLPFGWGPRICIGQHFALMEAKLAMSLILQHFSFELSQSYAHAPYMVITLQPQFGTHIILHKL